MDPVAQVRTALKPLFDSGIVIDVRRGAFATYAGSPPPPHTNIVVVVNDDECGKHRAEIDRLIQEAGINNVLLRIERQKG